MRNPIKNIVENKVHDATFDLLTYKIPIDANINYFIDDIFLDALQYLAQHFLNEKKLRDSEKLTLVELTSDCDREQAIVHIKQNLIRNLNNIKPKWGELFGKDRGDVFHAFRYLLQWPCFSNAFRARMKTEKIAELEAQLHLQSLELSSKDSHIEEVGTSLKHNETIARKTAERATSQFIQIQKLTMENKALKSELKALKHALTPKKIHDILSNKP